MRCLCSIKKHSQRRGWNGKHVECEGMWEHRQTCQDNRLGRFYFSALSKWKASQCGDDCLLSTAASQQKMILHQTKEETFCNQHSEQPIGKGLWNIKDITTQTVHTVYPVSFQWTKEVQEMKKSNEIHELLTYIQPHALRLNTGHKVQHSFFK
jgi:hypothetical protein